MHWWGGVDRIGGEGGVWGMLEISFQMGYKIIEGQTMFWG